MSDDIYLQFGIDSSKLKRDYIKYPLKRIIKKTGGYKLEKPYKKDLEYIYIELNIPRIDLISYFNVSESTVKRWLRYYNNEKDKNLEQINREKNCLKKYGVGCSLQSKEVQEKIKQTNLEKYGVEYPLQSKEVKEKQKQTNLEKYGVENPAQLKEIQEKKKQTCLEKYGVESTNQLKEVKEKKYNTMKKNHTFTTSKPEEQIYELLKLKFKEVKRQYKDERYPFNCDFYIPEMDLFIEYQGTWMHENKPYIGSKEQKEKIKLWESKNTPQYKRAIDTWTIRDPLKRKTAKLNNLNYFEFFNQTQFLKWYNKL